MTEIRVQIHANHFYPHSCQFVNIKGFCKALYYIQNFPENSVLNKFVAAFFQLLKK